MAKEMKMGGKMGKKESSGFGKKSASMGKGERKGGLAGPACK